MSTPVVDVTSHEGWHAIQRWLPDDLERLAKDHGVLEVQYGDAKISTGRDRLRRNRPAICTW